MANSRAKELMNSIAVAMMVVIMVVIAALIVGSITSNDVFSDIPITGTNTNETLSAVDNVTASTFAVSAQPSVTCTLDVVHNATGGETLTAGNYTFTSSGCTLILADSSTYIGEDLNVTYDYSYASGTSTAGLNITTVTNSFGSFVTNLIAFLAVIGTILGVVWLVVYVRRLFDKEEGLQGISA